MFPFIIKYSSTIEEVDLDESQVLTSIKQAVEAEKAKVVYVGYNEIIYSGTTARFITNMNFALTVDKARFLVLRESSKIKLTYEIYLHKLIYFSSAAAVFMGLVSYSFLSSLFVLLWIGGINIGLIYIQHSAFFHNVKDRLKPVAADVINGETKKILTKEDKKEAMKAILIVLLTMTLIILLIMFAPL